MDELARSIRDMSPQALYAMVRENQTTLDLCLRHHFPTFPEYKLGMKLVCARCGGTMDALHAYAYTRGYAAAGGDPNDVIPGWRTPLEDGS